MRERVMLKQEMHGAKMKAMASKSESLYAEPSFAGFHACETGGHTGISLCPLEMLSAS